MVFSKDAETRRNDYEEKVVIYQRVRIQEYLILDPPSRITRQTMEAELANLRPELERLR